MSIRDRIQHAWNAFINNRDPTYGYRDTGMSYSYRPDRPRFSGGNERTIASAIYNRIALDVSSVDIRHVRLNEDEQFISYVKSGLDYCLTSEANIDQTGRALLQDIVISMFDEGHVAVVPVDTIRNPTITGSYDINSLRTGKILEWRPKHVKVRLYNEQTGNKEDLVLPKSMVAIIENPLYSVVNEHNSTLKRLIRKLNILDAIDEQSGSGKLDLIVQLPYIVKTESRKKQAEERRKSIEEQLAGSKYGIAYTDGTERITQLNRPVDNNLMKQIEYLTSMLYSQLGINESILNGTADEKTLSNYFRRSIEPILSAIVDEMKRKFLTKTARSQGQSIMYFNDPFKLVTLTDIATIADPFSRNAILSSNEIRHIIGRKPSNEPIADELSNKNLNPVAPIDPGTPPVDETEGEVTEDDLTEDDYEDALSGLDDLDAQLDELEDELDDEVKHYASKYYDPVKAHEYYLKTRELKGRKSTAGLNENGKNAASYVKEQLYAERDGKINSHKNQTDRQIEALQNKKKSDIESVKNQTDRQIEALQNKKKSDIESVKNRTNSQIDTLREQKKSKIEAHKNATQNKIDSLKNMLDGLSKEQKAKVKEEIYSKIASLREENQTERNRLNEEFNVSRDSLRSDQKAKNESIRSDYSTASASERSKQREKSESIRSNYSTASKAERSKHKQYKADVKEYYDEKYVQELDKIREEATFTEGAKGSKGSKKNKKRPTGWAQKYLDQQT